MDGFCVVGVDDLVLVQFVVMVIGCDCVVLSEQFVLLLDGVMLVNVGYVDCEIDVVCFCLFGIVEQLVFFME